MRKSQHRHQARRRARRIARRGWAVDFLRGLDRARRSTADNPSSLAASMITTKQVFTAGAIAEMWGRRIAR